VEFSPQTAEIEGTKQGEQATLKESENVKQLKYQLVY